MQAISKTFMPDFNTEHLYQKFYHKTNPLSIQNSPQKQHIKRSQFDIMVTVIQSVPGCLYVKTASDGV